MEAWVGRASLVTLINLVFEGGGVKGGALIGAVSALAHILLRANRSQESETQDKSKQRAGHALLGDPRHEEASWETTGA